ncbi:hypothetical protein [Pseudoalteromonas phenolica]|uniref:hypothetical protein n=1 Tax=Pseudoalteromonas phenolica TaxID=161398 RepID=UPI00384F4E2E
MKKTIISAVVLAFLSGCGSSTEEQSTTPPQIEEQLEKSEFEFYVPSFIGKSGVLNIVEPDSNTTMNKEVADITTFTMSLDEQKRYQFKFTPSNSTITCPLEAGCGRSIRNDPNDLNGNNEIDFGEPLTAELTHQASIFSVAGVNKVIFSPFSTLMFDRGLANNRLSLTSSPVYHLTHSNQSQSLSSEYIADAISYADVITQHRIRELGSNFAQTYDIVLNETENAAWKSYQSLSNEYLRILLLDPKRSVLYSGQSALVNSRLNALFEPIVLSNENEFDADRKKALLVQLREAIGVLRLQEEKYSDELTTRFNEIEVLINQDAQRAIELLSTSILDAVLEVSPAKDSFPGRYRVNGLTIDYSDGPFTWKVSGVREGYDIEMDVVMPTWRKSASLGDKIEGSGVAKISKGELTVTLDLSDILLELDGTIDTNNSDSTTGDGIFKGTITLNQPDAELKGQVDLNVKRQLLEEQLDTIVTSFAADATLTTTSQLIPIKVYANERTPFTVDSANLAFGIELGLELNGGKDLRLQFIGDPDMLSELNQGDVFLLNNNKVMEVVLRTAGDNINLVARGEHGYWLDLKKKGKNYTGGYYLGDKQVGDIQTVRGIPGILFPDSTFESLF